MWSWSRLGTVVGLVGVGVACLLIPGAQAGAALIPIGVAYAVGVSREPVPEHKRLGKKGN